MRLKRHRRIGRDSIRHCGLALLTLLLLTPAVPGQCENVGVTTLAGSAGNAGSTNGTGAAARFNGLDGVEVDGRGNVYVADTSNHTIRMITPDGVVTTLAGSIGIVGSADGIGAAARFMSPFALAADSKGNIYVADGNHLIRKVTPTGVVTTLAGLAGVTGATDGTGSSARFNTPRGIATDAADNIYVVERENHVVRKITPAGVVTTIAGRAGVSGSTNGPGNIARFNRPFGITADRSGNLYVAEGGNHLIRKITPAGIVTTLAGQAGVAGNTNGLGGAARFNNPEDVATDAAGNVYVADTLNHLIRRITPEGSVSTLAGTGNPGSANGNGPAASFERPVSIASDPAGNLFVGDLRNQLVRKIGNCPIVSLVATLGQAFAGPLGNDNTFTSVEITQTDPDRPECAVEVSFDQGAQAAPVVMINGAVQPDNAMLDSIPRGGARTYQITADELAIGMVKIRTQQPCSGESLVASGSYTVEGEEGGITEAFNIVANTADAWLRDDQCRVFTAFLGIDEGGFSRNTGMATASVSGETAPDGTQLMLDVFDGEGAPVDVAGFDPLIPVTGVHTPVFPFDPGSLGLNGLFTVVACLDVPFEGNAFTLDMTLVGVKQKGGGLQFESETFVAGFPAGDPSAWTANVP